ncbi:MAG: glutathione transporter ATP-binding protein GsiA [Bacteroidota bacterium]|jgi:peptide/nickel transport system ATP-binding protein
MHLDEQLLLSVHGFSLSLQGDDGQPVSVLREVSFEVPRGETLGLAGASGSGKTMCMLALLGLLPAPIHSMEGELKFRTARGEVLDLARLPEREHRTLRGKEIAMVFQDPHASLNPTMRCGEQVAEVFRYRQGLSKAAARRSVHDLFERVRLPDTDRMFRSYPHQLSGGQRQRVMLAVALAGRPALLIADEPTSAIDVTTRQALLSLLQELRSDWGGTTIFISHDLGAIAQVADRVLVMEKGTVREEGPTHQILHTPVDRYTNILLEDYRRRFQPVVEAPPPVSPADAGRIPSPLLAVSELSVSYGRRSMFGGYSANTAVKAVDQVSLSLQPGETLGIVGESGSGKTSLVRALLGLLPIQAGTVRFMGEEWSGGGGIPSGKKGMQAIFQDPYASLNPRIPIGLAITEPMRVHGLGDRESSRREKAVELLELTGIGGDAFWRYPAAFSGGQRQRISIARALATQPACLICDECLSSLDATVQWQVLDLLRSLQQSQGIGYLFISHDLPLVRHISHRIAVMQAGRLVEINTTQRIWRNPEHPYTKSLLAALPPTPGGQ